MLTGSEKILNRYKFFARKGLDWFYKNIVLYMAYDAIKEQGSKILLEDSFAKFVKGKLFDDKTNITIDYTIKFKWLGNDVGNDLLFNYGNTFEGILNNLREREPKFDTKTQEKINIMMNFPYSSDFFE